MTKWEMICALPESSVLKNETLLSGFWVRIKPLRNSLVTNGSLHYKTSDVAHILLFQISVKCHLHNILVAKSKLKDVFF